MAKRPKQTNLPVVRAGRAICGQRMEAVYHVPALQPEVRGPWDCEVDKAAWTDSATGLPCIIRRDPQGGHLCGFVGLPIGHPLFGFRADTIPATVIWVHGGINYAEPCDQSKPHEISICHVAGHHPRETFTQRPTDLPITEADDAWWFGFSCDQVTDEIPGNQEHAAQAQRLGLKQTYRDEAFVFEQCTSLAAQLAAAGRDEVRCDHTIGSSGEGAR